MKLLFFGSPVFAVPSLRALHGAGHEVAMIVTQPDRPKGRHRTLVPTAVKEAAGELALPVYQPARASAPDSVEFLASQLADLAVTVAYGEVLAPEVLETTEGGYLNVHASLLPDYRGAAPINWAVIRGETETGVSVIRMAPKLDAGPVLAQRRTPIGPDETAGELSERLAEMGAEAVVEVMGRLAAGEDVQATPQPARTCFFARKLTKEDGRLDWSLTAEEIHNRIRGLTPGPGAYCELGPLRLALLSAGVAAVQHPAGEPGAVVGAGEDGILVRTGAGVVCLRRLKPAGGRAMDAGDFLRGHRVSVGDRFS